jgi:hypothetical protein
MGEFEAVVESDDSEFRTRKRHIRTNTPVRVSFDAKIKNAIYVEGVLEGYRVSDGHGFWSYIPEHAVGVDTTRA